MPVTIEAESPQDAAAIREVVGRAFADQPAVMDLVEAIRSSPQYIPELALLARAGDAVIGFVMISCAELAESNGNRHQVLTLSPLAVAPAHQKQGVGAALVRAVLNAADESGAALVTVEGSPAYYGRFGFRYAADFGIRIAVPDWAPPTAGQVIPLSGYHQAVRGTLEYPPAFADLE